MCNKMQYRVLVVAAISVLLLGLLACGGAGEEMPSGEALVQDRCSRCHDLEVVTSEQMTRDQWARTVANMVARGAELTEQEQEIVVDYLAEEYGP